MEIDKDLEEEINEHLRGKDMDFYESNDSTDKRIAIKFKKDMISKYNISEGKFITQLQVVINNRKEEYEKNIPVRNVPDDI